MTRNIFDVFKKLKSNERFESDVVSALEEIENLTFNSKIDEIVSALDDFSKRYPKQHNQIRETHCGFLANVYTGLFNKIWRIKKLEIQEIIIKNLSIKLYLKGMNIENTNVNSTGINNIINKK